MLLIVTREIRRDALNREQNLIRIHEDIINNLLLSFLL